jgi:hypothetical protein
MLVDEQSAIPEKAGAADVVCGDSHEDGRMFPLEIADLIERFVPNPGVHAGESSIAVCKHMCFHPERLSYQFVDDWRYGHIVMAKANVTTVGVVGLDGIFHCLSGRDW